MMAQRSNPRLNRPWPSLVFKGFKTKAGRELIFVLIFFLVSLIPTFVNVSKLDRGFLSIVDAGIPYYPKSELGDLFQAIDGRFGYGFERTNWQVFSKSLPLFGLVGLFKNHETAIRLFFSLLIFGAISSGFLLFRRAVRRPVLAAALAVFYGLSTQVFFWLLYSPNIALAYAALPLLFYSFLEFHDRLKAGFPTRHFLIFGLSFLLLLSADISYALVGLLGFFILAPFVILARGRAEILVRLKTSLLALLFALSLGLLVVSGLLSGLIFSGSKSYINADYSAEAVEFSATRADIFSSIRLGSGALYPFADLDPRPTRFYEHLAVKEPSVVMMLGLFLLAIFFRPRSPLVRAAMFLVLLGGLLSAGRWLPNWPQFYQKLYQIPGLYIVRNMVKFNFLELLGLFIVGAFVFDRLLDRFATAKERSSKLAGGLVLSLLFAPFVIGSVGFLFRDMAGLLKFSRLPADYHQLNSLIAKDEIWRPNELFLGRGFRIFFYPLKNPVEPEKYTWNRTYGTQKPFLATLLDRPNNLDIPIEQHPPSIDIFNMLGDQFLEDRVLTFWRALGNLSYRYLVFRKDVPKELENGQSVERVRDGLLTLDSAGFKPFFQSDNLIAFETPSRLLRPIAYAEGGRIVKASKSFHRLSIAPDWRENSGRVAAVINSNRVDRWLAHKPRFSGRMGAWLADRNALLFGVSLIRNRPDSQACEAYLDLIHHRDLSVGNCLVFGASADGNNPELILVEPLADYLTRQIKYLALLLAGLLFLLTKKGSGAFFFRNS